jgi:hypothetical protein
MESRFKKKETKRHEWFGEGGPKGNGEQVPWWDSVWAKYFVYVYLNVIMNPNFVIKQKCLQFQQLRRQEDCAWRPDPAKSTEEPMWKTN